MKLKKLKVNFKDKRGFISDIFYNKNIQHVSIIKSKPNALRGDPQISIGDIPSIAAPSNPVQSNSAGLN